MYSSSKAHKQNKRSPANRAGGKKGKAKGNHADGYTGGDWNVVKTKFGKNTNPEDEGRYFFDSYRVGTANGKVKELGKYFCNCEELNKLIHKDNLTKKERTVLFDMAKRYKVCLNFAHGGQCYEYNCGFKHTWFNGKDALRQAGCELKFTGKMCSFCKARPNVVSEFARRRAENKARRAQNSDRASNAGSSMSFGSSTSNTPMPRRPNRKLYNPKSLALNAAALPSKPTLSRAEEFPCLGANKSAKAVQPKSLRSKKCIPTSPKEDFEPAKKSDTPIKFSELPGTDLPQPVGSKASLCNSSRIHSHPTAPSISTKSDTPVIEKNVFEYTEAPSEYDPNDYTSEASSSNTSVANSTKESQETAIEEPSKENVEPTAAPATNDVLKEKDTVSMMHDMVAMMQQMRAEMQILKAQNAELRARVAK